MEEKLVARQKRIVGSVLLGLIALFWIWFLFRLLQRSLQRRMSRVV